MTFEQAGAEFARLRYACQAGQMDPAQFHSAVSQLRVVDAAGQWWQPDPSTGQWLVWNGASWSYPAPQPPVPQPVVRPVAAPAATARPSGGHAMDGLLSMLPGIGVQLFQRWGFYKTNPMAAVQFLVPALLSTVAMALAPKIGRVLAILMVLACLGWLSWPVISQWAGVSADPAAGLRDNAGRGLAGMSMLYMIPRLWQAGKR